MTGVINSWSETQFLKPIGPPASNWHGMLGERPPHRIHGLHVARDIVEIVAIVLAGIWAFYTFVYENQIKPAFAPPELNFSATLQKVGEHRGLVGVRIRAEYENVGTTHLHFLGLAINVDGQNVRPSRALRPAELTPSDAPNTATLQAFYTLTPRTPVFTLAYLTQLADPRTGFDYGLDPGNKFPIDEIFYVPSRRFDRLIAHMDVIFVKSDVGRWHARIVHRPYGLGVKSDDAESYGSSQDVAIFDLDGP
jgi:hypothetical protein